MIDSLGQAGVKETAGGEDGECLDFQEATSQIRAQNPAMMESFLSVNVAIHYLKRDYGSSDQNLSQIVLLMFSLSESTCQSYNNDITRKKNRPLRYFNYYCILNLLRKETGSVFKPHLRLFLSKIFKACTLSITANKINHYWDEITKLNENNSYFHERWRYQDRGKKS